MIRALIVATLLVLTVTAFAPVFVPAASDKAQARRRPQDGAIASAASPTAKMLKYDPVR